MRAAINRALLVVHGQPDAWETPYCSGSGCRQGDAPQACNCRTCLVVDDQPEFRWAPAPGYVLHPDLHRVTLTELDLELPHDDQRVIRAPLRRPALPDPMRRKRLSLAAATAALALIAFGVLLWCASTRAHSPTATVFVGR